jgi:hypothetical protein
MEKLMKSNYSNLRAVSFIVVSALAAAPALAQSNPPAGKAAPESKAEAKSEAETQEILKFSQDGNAALRDIEAARLAIFYGKPKLAIEQAEKAKIKIEKGQEEAAKFLSNAKASGSRAGKPEMIPVDGQLMVMDDFVPTDEKKAHLASANEHLKKGEHEAALKELNLSDIKIIYNRLWMPIMPALKRLDQALKLMDEHKYYEANLALKAIGDSLTIETESMTETPEKTSSEPGTAPHQD